MAPIWGVTAYGYRIILGDKNVLKCIEMHNSVNKLKTINSYLYFKRKGCRVCEIYLKDVFQKKL